MNMRKKRRVQFAFALKNFNQIRILVSRKEMLAGCFIFFLNSFSTDLLTSIITWLTEVAFYIRQPQEGFKLVIGGHKVPGTRKWKRNFELKKWFGIIVKF